MKPITKRVILSVAALAALVITAGMLWQSEVQQLPAQTEGSPNQTVGSQTTTTGASRKELGTDQEKGEPDDQEFRSVLVEGEVVDASPQRDGLVVVLLDAEGRPLQDKKIKVRWRKGLGMYGNDSGRTEGGGRFPTTVARTDQVEIVTSWLPNSGTELRYYGDFETVLGQPEVIVRMPVMRTFSGRVLSMDHEPIADAMIAVERKRTLADDPSVHVLGTDEIETSSGPGGQFSIEVPAGHYIVSSTKDGHSAFAKLRVHISVARADTAVEIFLAKALSDRRVLVTVELPPGVHWAPRVSAATRHMPDQVSQSATTFVEPVELYRSIKGQRLSDGTYLLEGLEPTPMHVSVSARGCKATSVPLPLADDRVTVRLEKRPEDLRPRFGGKVIDQSGNPVRSAKVGMLRDTRIAHANFVSSGGQGQFSFPLDSQEPCFVIVRASGYGFRAVGPIALDQPPKDLIIELAPSSLLQGRVVDRSGQPVQAHVIAFHERGVFTALQEPNSKSRFLHIWSTDDMVGSSNEVGFKIDEVAEGWYEVWADPYSGSLPPGRVVMRAGETADIVLGEGLEECVVVRGKVFDAGTKRPIPGAEVSARRHVEDRGRNAFEVGSDGDGEFELAGASPGRLRIETKAHGYAFASMPYRKYEKGRTRIDIAMTPTHLLRVEIVDAQGLPLRGAPIIAYDASGQRIGFQDGNGSWNGTVVTTDLAGRADLRGLPQSKVRLVVGEQKGTWNIANATHPTGKTKKIKPEEFELDLIAPRRDLVRLVLSF